MALDCLWELVTDTLKQNKYSTSRQINGLIVKKQAPTFWVVTFFICQHEPRLRPQCSSSLLWSVWNPQPFSWSCKTTLPWLFTHIRKRFMQIHRLPLRILHLDLWFSKMNQAHFEWQYPWGKTSEEAKELIFVVLFLNSGTAFLLLKSLKNYGR